MINILKLEKFAKEYGFNVDSVDNKALYLQSFQNWIRETHNIDIIIHPTKKRDRYFGELWYVDSEGFCCEHESKEGKDYYESLENCVFDAFKIIKNKNKCMEMRV